MLVLYSAPLDSGVFIFTVRNEVAKDMFLQAFVCPQGGGGGVCLSACWDTIPQGQTPPEQTPLGSRHPPPRADTPRADTPREQTPPPGADTPLEHPPPQSRPPPPEIRSLLQTVCILLECILVFNVPHPRSTVGALLNPPSPCPLWGTSKL